MANDSNCSYLSEEDINQLSLARGVSAIVAFVCCCLTLLLILLHRAFKTTLQRLFLYVPASLTVHIAVNIMQIRSSPEEYCQAVGFLNQYTLHVTFLFMLGLFCTWVIVCASQTQIVGNRHNQPNQRRVGSMGRSFS